jgi:hypothetical protein
VRLGLRAVVRDFLLPMYPVRTLRNWSLRFLSFPFFTGPNSTDLAPPPASSSLSQGDIIQTPPSPSRWEGGVGLMAPVASPLSTTCGRRGKVRSLRRVTRDRGDADPDAAPGARPDELGHRHRHRHASSPLVISAHAADKDAGGPVARTARERLTDDDGVGVPEARFELQARRAQSRHQLIRSHRFTFTTAGIVPLDPKFVTYAVNRSLP